MNANTSLVKTTENACEYDCLKIFKFVLANANFPSYRFRDLINGYECSCINGYSGLRCEERDNRCSSVTCQNGGECRDGLSSFM